MKHQVITRYQRCYLREQRCIFDRVNNCFYVPGAGWRTGKPKLVILPLNDWSLKDVYDWVFFGK